MSLKTLVSVLFFSLPFFAFANEVKISEPVEVLGKNLPDHVQKTLTEEQKNELYLKGTITDEKGQRWNIWVIPGSEYALSWHTEGQKFAKRIISLYGESEFWKEEVYERSVKNFVRAWKDGPVDIYQHGWVDLGEDYSENWDYYSKRIVTIYNDGQLGYQASIAAEAGKLGFSQVWETVYAASRVLWDALEGVAIASVGGVATPVAKVLLVPVGALVTSVGGSLTGGGLWLWNGSAYMVSKGANVPTKSSDWVFIENRWEQLVRKKEAEKASKTVDNSKK